MKNLFLWLALGFAMMAHAASYSYLEFTSTSGTKTAFAVTNLTISVNGTDLQVSNDNGTVNFVLTDLASMQFTASTTTALENILDGDQPVRVYSVTGASMGTYPSIIEATQTLKAGSYVISNGTHTQSIIVK